MAQLGEFGRERNEGDYVAPEPDVFTFHGEEFELPATISALPLLRFARDARDLDAEMARLRRSKGRARSEREREKNLRWEAEIQMREQASLYEYLQAMLPEEAWDRFQLVAASVGADIDELMAVANKIIGAVTSRPTKLPGGSPAGQLTTTTGSLDSSPSDGGRPALEAAPAAPAADYTVAPITQVQAQPAPTGAPEQTGAPSYEQVAQTLGISPREAQRLQWEAEMVPVDEIGSVL